MNLVHKLWMSYHVSWLRCQLRTFELNCQKYGYFCHRYNFTWRNERAVEVPIVWRAVKEAKNKRVLEIGNVLSHYFPIHHDVVDKYEQAKDVINEDIIKYKPVKPYDLIVSISTLEHVGWDETPKNKTKTVKALQSIRKMLAKGGKAIITFPRGYNLYLDELMKKNELKFDAIYCLQRITPDNQWMETKFSAIKKTKYGQPYNNANAIVVGILIN